MALRSTYRDGEHVHVVRLRAALEPDVIEDGTSTHSDRVERLGNDESETDGVPVGDPVVEALGDERVLWRRASAGDEEWNTNRTNLDHNRDRGED